MDWELRVSRYKLVHLEWISRSSLCGSAVNKPDEDQ